MPLADVAFGEEEQDAVRRVLESGWVSMGPETERFEDEFSRYLNVKHAVAVSSGTAALHLALLALGIGPGDEVILPSLTFVATANAVRYVGAMPVFADITSLDDWSISPARIEEKITPRTKAIIVVHYGGFPCRMELCKAIADKHGLKILEDAAHAPGASFQERKLGTWGDAGCFSFFSNKNMTTAEGGMVATNDDDMAKHLRILRSHGMTTLTWDRHRGHSFSYDVVETGYNYRMDEIRAALGRVQLSRLEEGNAARRRLTTDMRERLRDLEFLSLPFLQHDLDECSCHLFPILLNSSATRLSFMTSMREQAIQTSIHYPAIHRFSSYRGIPNSGLDLTEEVSERVVTLPLFAGMTSEHVDAVCAAVRFQPEELRTMEARCSTSSHATWGKKGA